MTTSDSSGENSMRRAVRLLLAAAALAGSAAVSAPAEAQPCVEQAGVFWVCVLPESWYRGVAGGLYGTGGVGPVLVGEGCYYPNGPRYFVHVYTGVTGGYEVIAPVGGVPCV